jgi:hypothetical protein
MRGADTPTLPPMLNDRTPQAVLDELADHPRRDDLARFVHAVAFAAADEKRSLLSEGLTEAADRAGVTAKDAETPFGNALRALEKSDREGPGEAAVLLAALVAHGVALAPPDGAEAEARVAESLVWISMGTPIDALSAIDAALGERAGGLWMAVGELLRRADAGAAPHVGRAGALVAAAALGASSSPIARGEAKVLAGEVRDPVVRALLSGPVGGGGAGSVFAGLAGSGEAVVATGELVPAPHGPVAFTLLAMTGILLVLRAGRLVGRWVLRYRRPAEMRFSARGVTVVSKTELLGRTLREHETHMPTEALLYARREVRYPRLAMYAGLFALAVGSYIGVSLFIDGTRSGSPELLGMGALVVALGIALDFALVSATPRARGRCRVVLVPRKGAAVALDRVDPAQADAALGRLAARV